MLVDLTVKEFLNKVAGSDPLPPAGCYCLGACRYGC